MPIYMIFNEGGFQEYLETSALRLRELTAGATAETAEPGTGRPAVDGDNLEVLVDGNVPRTKPGHGCGPASGADLGSRTLYSHLQ